MLILIIWSTSLWLFQVFLYVYCLCDSVFVTIDWYILEFWTKIQKKQLTKLQSNAVYNLFKPISTQLCVSPVVRYICWYSQMQLERSNKTRASTVFFIQCSFALFSFFRSVLLSPSRYFTASHSMHVQYIYINISLN